MNSKTFDVFVMSLIYIMKRRGDNRDPLRNSTNDIFKFRFMIILFNEIVSCYLDNFQTSGVATGWHGWTMSRGPGAKGTPERERPKKKRKKKMKNRKEKQKKKKKKEKKRKKERENETFQIPGRGPYPIYPMSFSR